MESKGEKDDCFRWTEVEEDSSNTNQMLVLPSRVLHTF